MSDPVTEALDSACTCGHTQRWHDKYRKRDCMIAGCYCDKYVAKEPTVIDYDQTVTV